jgi:hypothetical protein
MCITHRKAKSLLVLNQFKVAQQSVHLTLGILRKSQAVFYAFSFFWLDGSAVHSPSAGNAHRWAAQSNYRVEICGTQKLLKSL